MNRIFTWLFTSSSAIASNSAARRARALYVASTPCFARPLPSCIELLKGAQTMSSLLTKYWYIVEGWTPPTEVISIPRSSNSFQAASRIRRRWRSR